MRKELKRAEKCLCEVQSVVRAVSTKESLPGVVRKRLEKWLDELDPMVDKLVAIKEERGI